MKIKIILLLFIIASITSVLSADDKNAGATNPEALNAFEKGQMYFYQKKFEMAEVMLLESIKHDPENALAYSYLGDLFLNKKLYDEALKYYLRALELRPESAENNFRIAQTYYYMKNGKKAAEHFSKAYELDNTLTFAVYHIGLTNLMLNRDKENTISNWEKYIELAPDDPQKENILQVIELLKNPEFIIPSEESGISVEEALRKAGAKHLDETEQTPDFNEKLDKYEGLYEDKEL